MLQKQFAAIFHTVDLYLLMWWFSIIPEGIYHRWRFTSHISLILKNLFKFRFFVTFLQNNVTMHTYATCACLIFWSDYAFYVCRIFRTLRISTLELKWKCLDDGNNQLMVFHLSHETWNVNGVRTNVCQCHALHRDRDTSTFLRQILAK